MKQLDVFVGRRKAGELVMHGRNNFSFTYLTQDPSAAVSLTMPVRAEPYLAADLHPFFQQNLPEGIVRETLVQKFAKIQQLDSFGLLEVTGGNTIARVECVRKGLSPRDVASHDDGMMERVLHKENSSSLFKEMLTNFAEQSGISGLNPKVLYDDRAGERHSVIKTSRLIFKGSVGDPDLAINEYLCQITARAAGLPIAPVMLGDSGDVLVIARFDIDENNRRQGFEDFCSLIGKSSTLRYDSDNTDIVNMIRAYVAQPEAAVRDYYKATVLNHVLGNGDAHLKNFGVLYNDTSDRRSIRLAPFYDITSTVIQRPNDLPALKTNGVHAWLTRDELEKWGRNTCLLTPRDIRQANADVLDAVARVSAVMTHHQVSKQEFLDRLRTLWIARANCWEAGESFEDSPAALYAERCTA